MYMINTQHLMNLQKEWTSYDNTQRLTVHKFMDKSITKILVSEKNGIVCTMILNRRIKLNGSK